MPIVYVTNYMTPYQAALFSRSSDVIITYSRLDAHRQWAPLRAEAQIMDVSQLSLRKRLHKISCELNNSFEGTLIGGSSRSPEFWFAIGLCRLRRTPFAIWVERPRAPITLLRRNILRLAMGKSSSILAIGTAATIAYRRYIRGVKVINFPYSYGRNAPQAVKLAVPQNRVSSHAITALFIGAEWERKGLDILLKAMTAMPQELLSRLALRVVGLNALPAELDGISGMAPSADITYLGFLEPHDVQKELRSTDVLVVPSRYDGWAVVVEEAMAEGTPVIASDKVGAAADLVVDGYSGSIFPSGDTEALAAALTVAVTQDGTDQGLSVGAMAIAVQHRNRYNIESLERAICDNIELEDHPTANAST